MNTELKVMVAIQKQLEKLSEEEQKRVVAYFSNRYNEFLPE